MLEPVLDLPNRELVVCGNGFQVGGFAGYTCAELQIQLW